MTLKHDLIGTEYILLGLLREGEGVAAQVLADYQARKAGSRKEDVPPGAGSWRDIADVVSSGGT